MFFLVVFVSVYFVCHYECGELLICCLSSVALGFWFYFDLCGCRYVVFLMATMLFVLGGCGYLF